MIVSASRRTDIPAFYAEWFMRRIRAGFCAVPNPSNPRQVSRLSLDIKDVDVIVFWTRNPDPLLPFLPELDTRGYRCYFQYTLMDNPFVLDPGVPGAEKAIQSFLRLSGRVGPDRVLWRYDPIVLSTLTPPDFHCRVFDRLAGALRGATRRSIISLVDVYRKVGVRLDALRDQGVELLRPAGTGVEDMIRSMAATAASNGMELASCAEEGLESLGVAAGKCVDERLIERVFGIRVTHAKDRAQRPACRCVASRDIGMYDTCPAGCVYCYATTGAQAVARNRSRHDPAGGSLAGS